jgi:predicted membrane protein DUF2142
LSNSSAGVGIVDDALTRYWRNHGLTDASGVGRRADPELDAGGVGPTHTIPPLWRSRSGWLALGGLVAICGAWVFAVPPLSPPDEPSHLIRAAAVARGQWIGTYVRIPYGDVASVQVPRSYWADVPVECTFNPAGPSCPVTLPRSRRKSETFTIEFRYLPLYYAAVGLPSLVWPDRRGDYASRLVSMLACVALLAAGLVSACALTDRRLGGLAFLLALTPTVVYLAVAVNPNGIEIAASISVWAAALALALRNQTAGAPLDVSDRRLLGRLGLSTIVLCLIRPLGPFFALCALFTAAWVAPAARRLTLARARSFRRWMCLASLAAGINVWWTLAVSIPHKVEHVGVGLGQALGRTGTVIRQSLEVFPIGRPYVDPVLVIPWALFVITVVLCVRLPLRQVVMVGLVVLGTLWLPISSGGLNLPNVGFDWQARFGLPLFCGALLLPASLLVSRTNPAAVSRWWLVICGSALGAAQLVALWISLHRYMIGAANGRWLIIFGRASWQPPLPALVLALGVIAGYALVLGAIEWSNEEKGRDPMARLIGDIDDEAGDVDEVVYGS